MEGKRKERRSEKRKELREKSDRRKTAREEGAVVRQNRAGWLPRGLQLCQGQPGAGRSQYLLDECVIDHGSLLWVSGDGGSLRIWRNGMSEYSALLRFYHETLSNNTDTHIAPECHTGAPRGHEDRPASSGFTDAFQRDF